MHKKDVLIVEDEAILLELLERAFLNEGFTVHKATNGAEALTTLNNNPYIGVVLSDIRMPLVGGFELRKKSAELPKTHQPLIWIALTAHLTKETEEPDAKLFDEIFFKPFSPKMIALSVKKKVLESEGGLVASSKAR